MHHPHHNDIFIWSLDNLGQDYFEKLNAEQNLRGLLLLIVGNLFAFAKYRYAIYDSYCKQCLLLLKSVMKGALYYLYKIEIDIDRNLFQSKNQIIYWVPRV